MMRDEQGVGVFLQSINEAELRLKQRELQQLQDGQVQQLRAVIGSLQDQLDGLRRQMAGLKEDYTYNLELLEAKDTEINRLDVVVRNAQLSQEQSEATIKSLLLKIDSLESQEFEKISKITKEKAENKVILLLFLAIETAVFN